MKGQHSTPGHVGLCTNSSDSHNTNRPIITIRLNGKPIPALIDTGADVNLRLAKEGNTVNFSDDENYDSSSESDAEEWQAIEQAITNYQPSESEDSEIQPPEPVLVDVDIHEPPRQINPNLRSDSLEAIQQINAITDTIQPFEQIIARSKNLSEKSYQEMEEAMTQACLKLDSVENPKGEVAIRSTRKSAIAFIEKLSGSLYHKFSNPKKVNKTSSRQTPEACSSADTSP